MLLGQPFTERLNATALSGMVPGGKEVNTHFARAVDGLLRNFTADKGINAKACGAVDKAFILLYGEFFIQ